MSLSSGDYPGIDELVGKLSGHIENLSLSLPSLHINSFSLELMEALSPRKKMGLTFAPEAGSDRMRRVINKQLTEQEILDTFAEVFKKGWLSVKLYFMIGLPTETKEDIEAIGQLVDKIRDQAISSPVKCRKSGSTLQLLCLRHTRLFSGSRKTPKRNWRRNTKFWCRRCSEGAPGSPGAT